MDYNNQQYANNKGYALLQKSCCSFVPQEILDILKNIISVMNQNFNIDTCYNNKLSYDDFVNQNIKIGHKTCTNGLKGINFNDNDWFAQLIHNIYQQQLTEYYQRKVTLNTPSASRHIQKDDYLTTTVESNVDLDELLKIADNINLIHSFNATDLTDDGLKAAGLIDHLVDVNDASSTTIKDNELPMGICEIISTEEGNHYIIKCPYTGSTDIYPLGNDIYASFETDQPFKVRASLADFLD